MRRSGDNFSPGISRGRHLYTSSVCNASRSVGCSESDARDPLGFPSSAVLIQRRRCVHRWFVQKSSRHPWTRWRWRWQWQWQASVSLHDSSLCIALAHTSVRRPRVWWLRKGLAPPLPDSESTERGCHEHRSRSGDIHHQHSIQCDRTTLQSQQATASLGIGARSVCAGAAV